MTEDEMKLLPFTVSVKPMPPAAAEEGEIELIEGAGLGDWGDWGDSELEPAEELPFPPQLIKNALPAKSKMARNRYRYRMVLSESVLGGAGFYPKKLKAGSVRRLLLP